MRIMVATIGSVVLVVAAPSAFAQVAYDTSQLDQRADVERNRILLRSTMRQKKSWDARRSGASQAQASACADRPRFRREYGADNPKVRRLESLCARAGY